MIKASKILVLILCGLFFSVAGLSDTKAIQDFKISGRKMRVEINEVKSATTDKPLTRNQAEAIVSVVVDVAHMVGPMALPQNVRLNISQLSFNPSANAMVDELNLGVRFAFIDDKNKVYTQNPRAMRAITAHEFGHLIFAHNIIAAQNIRGEMSRYSREAGEMESMLKEIRDEGEKLQALGASQGISPELQAKIDQIEKDFVEGLDILAKIQAKYSEVLALYDRTASYNEFFADVVSLVYTENPNAIAESIHFVFPKTTNANHSKSKSDVLSREFEAGKTLRHGPHTPHAVFAQVREELWENYLKRPQVIAKKAEVVQAVAQAVNEEIAWIFTKKSIPNDRRAVRVLNERLWKAIDAKLSALQ